MIGTRTKTARRKRSIIPDVEPNLQKQTSSGNYLLLVIALAGLTILLERAFQIVLEKYPSAKTLLASHIPLNQKSSFTPINAGIGFLLVALVLHGFYRYPAWWPEYVTISWAVSGLVLCAIAFLFRTHLYLRAR